MVPIEDVPLPVAQEAYQMTMELCRAHPDDSYLAELHLAWTEILHASHERHHKPTTTEIAAAL